MLSVKAIFDENSSQSPAPPNVGKASRWRRSLGGRLRFALGIAAGLFSHPFLATKPAAAQDASASRGAVIAHNIGIDAATQRVLVGYGEGAIAAIDFSQTRKSADFPVPAHPESFQRDPVTGWIFVNVPKVSAIVVIDGLTGKQTASWPLRGAGGNFPMALDEARRRVLVAFRAPARLGVFSMEGQTVANVELCGDADDVFVDSRRNHAYVSCGQGFIDVLDILSADYRRLARILTVPGARTAYFAPAMDRLFLAVRATSSEPAAIWVFHAQP
jgi:hypothetical protein